MFIRAETKKEILITKYLQSKTRDLIRSKERKKENQIILRKIAYRRYELSVPRLGYEEPTKYWLILSNLASRK